VAHAPNFQLVIIGALFEPLIPRRRDFATGYRVHFVCLLSGISLMQGTLSKTKHQIRKSKNFGFSKEIDSMSRWRESMFDNRVIE
jgi:hypothetical protein